MWGMSSNWLCLGQDMECEMKWYLAHILYNIETSFNAHLHVWYLYSLKMEAVCSSETLVGIYETTCCCNTRNHNMNLHHLKNLKYYNIKFYLSTAWRHTREEEVQLHLFLTSALGVEWLISYPDHFIPEKEPKYPSNRRLGGPQSQSRCFEEKKNLWIWTPDHLAHSIVTIPTSALQLVPQVL